MSSSQGWFESDEDYDTRVRREANEAIVDRGTGATPKQGWFEGDHDYRSRIAHEANKVRARDDSGSDDELSSDSSRSYSNPVSPGNQQVPHTVSAVPPKKSFKLIFWICIVVAVLGFWMSNRRNETERYATTTDSSQSDFIEEFDSNLRGMGTGISYVTTPTGLGAAFGHTKASAIEYSFGNGFPKEGTLEWRIFVTNGFSWDRGIITDSKPDALIFTTVGPDTWYAGCSWLTVSRDGSVNFGMADSIGGQTPLRSLVARDTTFSFNEWHTIGISFGSHGRSINVDGHIVAQDELSLHLAVGGTPHAQIGTPTIGQMKSRFWPIHSHDSGFEGVVDTFRASSKQTDWKLCQSNQGDKVALSHAAGVSPAPLVVPDTGDRSVKPVENGSENKAIQLIQAAKDGNLQAVQASLSDGADVNTKDKDGQPVLMLAADNGQTEIVKLLLDKGADVNVKKTDLGTSALWIASQKGHTETVKLLL